MNESSMLYSNRPGALSEAATHGGANGIARTQGAAAEFAGARGLLQRTAGQYDDHRPLAR